MLGGNLISSVPITMTTFLTESISKKDTYNQYYQYEKNPRHGYLPQEELKSNNLGVLEKNYQKQAN